MSTTVLVAGVGNIFLSDDGFGVAVARVLGGDMLDRGMLSRDTDSPLPDGVTVRDFGIRAVHLAYELLDGYDGLILVDAVSQGGPPGTIYVLEPDLYAVQAKESAALAAHSMSPDTVFSLLKGMGAELKQIFVVGCEPGHLGEGMDLSPAVAAAVGHAAEVVRDLAAQMLSGEHLPGKQRG